MFGLFKHTAVCHTHNISGWTADHNLCEGDGDVLGRLTNFQCVYKWRKVRCCQFTWIYYSNSTYINYIVPLNYNKPVPGRVVSDSEGRRRWFETVRCKSVDELVVVKWSNLETEKQLNKMHLSNKLLS